MEAVGLKIYVITIYDFIQQKCYLNRNIAIFSVFTSNSGASRIQVVRIEKMILNRCNMPSL